MGWDSVAIDQVWCLLGRIRPWSAERKSRWVDVVAAILDSRNLIRRDCYASRSSPATAPWGASKGIASRGPGSECFLRQLHDPRMNALVLPARRSRWLGDPEAIKPIRPRKPNTIDCYSVFWKRIDDKTKGTIWLYRCREFMQAGQFRGDGDIH